MARRTKGENAAKINGDGANLGFEANPWLGTDKLRGHMDAAEYEHVVLGPIFLKYIADALQARYDVIKQDHYVHVKGHMDRSFDPCCGLDGTFLLSDELIETHGGRVGDISIQGQESNPTIWRLCKMNLAIRGDHCKLGPHHAGTFLDDLRKDLRSDFILANPPFTVSDGGSQRLREDACWKYGVPP